MLAITKEMRFLFDLLKNVLVSRERAKFHLFTHEDHNPFSLSLVPFT